MASVGGKRLTTTRYALQLQLQSQEHTYITHLWTEIYIIAAVYTLHWHAVSLLLRISVHSDVSFYDVCTTLTIIGLGNIVHIDTLRLCTHKWALAICMCSSYYVETQQYTLWWKGYVKVMLIQLGMTIHVYRDCNIWNNLWMHCNNNEDTVHYK